MRDLPPQQVQQILAGNPDLQLLDVREPWEYEICHIDKSDNIPMGDIPGQLNSLDAGMETLVICHHGARSMQVVVFLEHSGFKNVINLQGGIDAWARTVDPNMPQY